MVVKNHERKVCQSQGSPNTFAKTQARQVNEQRSFFVKNGNVRYQSIVFVFNMKSTTKPFFGFQSDLARSSILTLNKIDRNSFGPKFGSEFFLY